MKPQKPSSDNIAAYMQTAAYEQKRHEIQKEINQGKVLIDRSCFFKTPAQKAWAKSEKSTFKLNGNTAEFRKLFASYIPDWGFGSTFKPLNTKK